MKAELQMFECYEYVNCSCNDALLTSNEFINSTGQIAARMNIFIRKCPDQWMINALVNASQGNHMYA